MAPSRALQINAQTQGGVLREKYRLFYPTHCYQYCLSFNNLDRLLCDSCKLKHHLDCHIIGGPGELATACCSLGRGSWIESWKRLVNSAPGLPGPALWEQRGKTLGAGAVILSVLLSVRSLCVVGSVT